jgi:putative peptidoglycan lipid II flippase
MSASVVALPELAQLAAAGNMEILLARARRCIAGTTMVAAPVAALILVSGGFLIRILLQHGAFDRASTHLVFTTWAGYTVGLVPFSIGIMAARLISVTNVNYALVALGVVALPLNGVLDYLLMQKWGCLGISLSTSLVYCVTSTVMYAFLRSRLGNVVNRLTWSVILRSVLASTVAGGCLWTVRASMPNQWLGMVVGALVFTTVLFLGYIALGLLGTTPRGVVFLPAWAAPSEMQLWRIAKAEP